MLMVHLRLSIKSTMQRTNQSEDFSHCYWCDRKKKENEQLAICFLSIYARWTVVRVDADTLLMRAEERWSSYIIKRDRSTSVTNTITIFPIRSVSFCPPPFLLPSRIHACLSISHCYSYSTVVLTLHVFDGFQGNYSRGKLPETSNVDVGEWNCLKMEFCTYACIVHRIVDLIIS